MDTGINLLSEHRFIFPFDDHVHFICLYYGDQIYLIMGVLKHIFVWRLPDFQIEMSINQ